VKNVLTGKKGRSQSGSSSVRGWGDISDRKEFGDLEGPTLSAMGRVNKAVEKGGKVSSTIGVKRPEERK